MSKLLPLEQMKVGDKDKRKKMCFSEWWAHGNMRLPSSFCLGHCPHPQAQQMGGAPVEVCVHFSLAPDFFASRFI